VIDSLYIWSALAGIAVALVAQAVL